MVPRRRRRLPPYIRPNREAGGFDSGDDKSQDPKEVVHSPPLPRQRSRSPRRLGNITIYEGDEPQMDPDSKHSSCAQEPSTVRLRQDVEAIGDIAAATVSLYRTPSEGEGPEYMERRDRLWHAREGSQDQFTFLDSQVMPRLKELNQDDLIQQNVKKTKEVAALRNFLADYMADMEQSKVDLLRQNRSLQDELRGGKIASHRDRRYAAMTADALMAKQEETKQLKQAKLTTEDEKEALKRLLEMEHKNTSAVECINRELSSESDETYQEATANLRETEETALHFKNAHASLQEQMKELLQAGDRVKQDLVDIEGCLINLEPALEKVRYNVAASDYLTKAPQTETSNLPQVLRKSADDNGSPTSFSVASLEPRRSDLIGTGSDSSGVSRRESVSQGSESSRSGSTGLGSSIAGTPINTRARMPVTTQVDSPPDIHNMPVPIATSKRSHILTEDKGVYTEDLPPDLPLNDNSTWPDHGAAASLESDASDTLPAPLANSRRHQRKPSTPLQVFSNSPNLKLQDKATPVDVPDAVTLLSPVAYLPTGSFTEAEEEEDVEHHSGESESQCAGIGSVNTSPDTIPITSPAKARDGLISADADDSLVCTSSIESSSPESNLRSPDAIFSSPLAPESTAPTDLTAYDDDISDTPLSPAMSEQAPKNLLPVESADEHIGTSLPRTIHGQGVTDIIQPRGLGISVDNLSSGDGRAAEASLESRGTGPRPMKPPNQLNAGDTTPSAMSQSSQNKQAPPPPPDSTILDALGSPFRSPVKDHNDLPSQSPVRPPLSPPTLANITDMMLARYGTPSGSRNPEDPVISITDVDRESTTEKDSNFLEDSLRPTQMWVMEQMKLRKDSVDEDYYAAAQDLLYDPLENLGLTVVRSSSPKHPNSVQNEEGFPNAMSDEFFDEGYYSRSETTSKASLRNSLDLSATSSMNGDDSPIPANQSGLYDQDNLQGARRPDQWVQSIVPDSSSPQVILAPARANPNQLHIILTKMPMLPSWPSYGNYGRALDKAPKQRAASAPDSIFGRAVQKPPKQRSASAPGPSILLTGRRTTSNDKVKKSVSFRGFENQGFNIQDLSPIDGDVASRGNALESSAKPSPSSWSMLPPVDEEPQQVQYRTPKPESPQSISVAEGEVAAHTEAIPHKPVDLPTPDTDPDHLARSVIIRKKEAALLPTLETDPDCRYREKSLEPTIQEETGMAVAEDRTGMESSPLRSISQVTSERIDRMKDVRAAHNRLWQAIGREDERRYATSEDSTRLGSPLNSHGPQATQRTHDDEELSATSRLSDMEETARVERQLILFQAPSPTQTLSDDGSVPSVASEGLESEKAQNTEGLVNPDSPSTDSLTEGSANTTFEKFCSESPEIPETPLSKSPTGTPSITPPPLSSPWSPTIFIDALAFPSRASESVDERHRKHEHSKAEAALVGRTPPLTPTSIEEAGPLPVLTENSVTVLAEDVERLIQNIGTAHDGTRRTTDSPGLPWSPSMHVSKLVIKKESSTRGLTEITEIFDAGDNGGRAQSIVQISPRMYAPVDPRASVVDRSETEDGHILASTVTLKRETIEFPETWPSAGSTSSSTRTSGSLSTTELESVWGRHTTLQNAPHSSWSHEDFVDPPGSDRETRSISDTSNQTSPTPSPRVLFGHLARPRRETITSSEFYQDAWQSVIAASKESATPCLVHGRSIKRVEGEEQDTIANDISDDDAGENDEAHEDNFLVGLGISLGQGLWDVLEDTPTLPDRTQWRDSPDFGSKSEELESPDMYEKPANALVLSILPGSDARSPSAKTSDPVEHLQLDSSMQQRQPLGPRRSTTETGIQADLERRRFPSLDAGRSVAEVGVQVDIAAPPPAVPFSTKPARSAQISTSVQTTPSNVSPLDKPLPSPLSKPLLPHPSLTFSTIWSFIEICGTTVMAPAMSIGPICSVESISPNPTATKRRGANFIRPETAARICRVLAGSFFLLMMLATWTEMQEWRDGNISSQKYNQVMSWRSELFGWDPWDLLRYHVTIYFDLNKDLMV